MIADILKEQRKIRNLTQQEVAEIFHVTRQTVSNWENEKNYPDVPTLVAISDYFEVSLDYLMKGDEKYMAKMKQEAKLLRSIQVGSVPTIIAGTMLICSLILIIALFKGGSVVDILPYQLMLTIVTIWSFVIHFGNLRSQMNRVIGTSVSVFLFASLFVNLFSVLLCILSALQVVHF
ncbi:MAG: helix-turn-helix transcriptional regulator [Enterococcus sp.]|uniref:helix-turn-helix domain-containing protein n=1 Tax=Enterococcus devriesei TaxID=319970 RepID=UPI001C122E4D|nr:helix-turn-helix transcriptional regulator [Enterococcus devriesei]MBU5366146.1 helix-turn-helix domain-containing protein [Enterococcus devriesei]MDU6523253.1 helix-turn-helix transcriptional regulator [Enterococcus sp.]